MLSELRELGFDPQAIPRVPKGKRSPAKQEARKALRYSDAVFDKCWKRLRKEGAIKEV